jgi:hypothetical protein
MLAGCNSRVYEAKAAVQRPPNARNGPIKNDLTLAQCHFFVKTYYFCLGFDFSTASKTIIPSSGLVMMALQQQCG